MKPKTQRQKRVLAIIFLILCTAATVFLVLELGVPMVRFAREPEAFRAWVAERGVLGKLAYIFMMFLSVLVAVIPGEPFELVAGYAFGAVGGTLLCLFASALGSVAVFYLVRKFGRAIVSLFFSEEQLARVRFLHRTPRRDLILSLLFIIPGTPKDLLCYFAAMTDIRPSLFFLLCSLGRLPAIVTSTVGGNALGTGEHVNAALVFAITMLCSLLGLWGYHIYIKRKNEK